MFLQDNISDEEDSHFVNEDSEESKNSPIVTHYFEIGDHVDCRDQVGKWCNAEIVAVIFPFSFLQKRANLVKVHFTGWSAKYDEWIDINSDRIVAQWMRG